MLGSRDSPDGCHVRRWSPETRGVSGHSRDGAECSTYQRFSLEFDHGLCAAGVICDPRQSGLCSSRLVYPDSKSDVSRITWSMCILHAHYRRDDCRNSDWVIRQAHGRFHFSIASRHRIRGWLCAGPLLCAHRSYLRGRTSAVGLYRQQRRRPDRQVATRRTKGPTNLPQPSRPARLKVTPAHHGGRHDDHLCRENRRAVHLHR